MTSLTHRNPRYSCVGKNTRSRREFYITVWKEMYCALAILRTNIALLSDRKFKDFLRIDILLYSFPPV